MLLFVEVTSGLNPNAKVWQDLPGPGGSSDSTSGNGTEVPCQDSTSHVTGDCVGHWKHSATWDPPPEGASNGMDPTPDEVTPTPQGIASGVVDCTVPAGEQPPTALDLRDSLRKQLEFCFSRENLSKDLYLVSQMDSDHFVPICTIANIAGIKKLSTDLQLITEVLRSSPMVQVDDKGEKARPNHKRCIIILREVPETTPVEDVQSLFRGDTCPPVISCEFAHNNSWYITFRSDTDAQQAFQYLREEVKTFQGKPILARIKAKPIAINTFFPKNGYRVLDSGIYPQQPAPQPPPQSPQTQQYASHLFLQPVYGPQQQYPLYGLLPQAWSAGQPYFETPLAPFPNSPFVNGFTSTAGYKNNSTANSPIRPYYRNRSLGKTHLRGAPSEGAQTSGTLLTSDSTQSPHLTPGPQGQVSSYPRKQSPPPGTEQGAESGYNTRGRRGAYRGRRRRDDDRTLRPPTAETVVPKLDLAPSHFPPLPGATHSSQGEPVLENRMSDIVRGIYKEKELTTEVRSSPPVPVPGDPPHDPVPTPAGKGESVTCPAPPDPEPPTVSPQPPEPSPTENIVQGDTQTKSVASPSLTAAKIDRSPITPTQSEPRKLSYAEVCQRPVAPQPPRPPAPAAATKGEEGGGGGAEKPAEGGGQERPAEGRTREGQPACRGAGPPLPSASAPSPPSPSSRAGASRPREPLPSHYHHPHPHHHQQQPQARRPFAHRPSPQGLARRPAREQTVPPRSPK